MHLLASHPSWQEAAEEAKWTVLMQIMKDNLKEMDCVMIQQMLQAQASKNKGETVKHATKVVDGRMEASQTKQDEDWTQQVVIEGWQE